MVAGMVLAGPELCLVCVLLWMMYRTYTCRAGYNRRSPVIDIDSPLPNSHLLLPVTDKFNHLCILYLVSMAVPLVSDDGIILHLHQELCNAVCDDRAAKFQIFSEKVWMRLGHEPPLADAIVNDFVAMLHNVDNLLLAQLVIPELRPAAPAPDNPFQRDVLFQIQLRRPILDLFQARPTGYDTEAQRLHEEEKRILKDADWHRACLLLYGRANINDEQKENVRQWDTPPFHTTVLERLEPSVSIHETNQTHDSFSNYCNHVRLNCVLSAPSRGNRRLSLQPHKTTMPYTAILTSLRFGIAQSMNADVADSEVNYTKFKSHTATGAWLPDS
ncbi:hypothetical protein COCVIDRAFT_13475 [Bipolaris victoriae FI3]|uniref:Uncharacterized protein n=1 Tax=Bipolaris victoriae (strain FI3) TaxID=930091 RepID=W7EW14_BIPV3|nr:hypothetical protein COCVIDRAFT_13475 [Bipolaris victoriae FI3]